MKPFRRGLFLSATAALLVSASGCFWLEPIHGVPDPDPDGGVLPGDGGVDGGSDGGTDACEPGAPVPAEAQLLPFDPELIFHSLSDGPSLKVRVALVQPLAVPVRVDLSSNQPSIVSTAAFVCIPVDTDSVEVTLGISDVGEALVEAHLGAQSTRSLTVSVVAQHPVLQALRPSRAFVVENEQLTLTAELSGPVLQDAQVALTQGGASKGHLTVLQGADEGSGPFVLETANPNTLIEVVGTLTSGAGASTANALFKYGHVVLSEILWSSDGFVELHNPTSSQVDLSGWAVDARRSGPGANNLAIHTFEAGTLIAPGGFRLIVANPSGTGDHVFDDPSGDWPDWSNVEVRLWRPGQATAVDAVKFGDGPDRHEVPREQSAERIAWGGVTGPEMTGSGNHATRGNGWDTNDDKLDFILRSPDPQGSWSPTEAIE